MSGEHLGVIGVFLLMVPESACVPVPSEITLITAGFAVRMGWMSFPLAVLGATAGNLVGSMIAYGLGASHVLDGVPAANVVLRRWGGLLDRHGARAVFIARLLPLARTFVSLPAGARRVRLVPFIALTALGCTLWAIAFVSIGALAGAGWHAAGSAVGRVLLPVGLLALGLSLVRRRPPAPRPRPSRPYPGDMSPAAAEGANIEINGVAHVILRVNDVEGCMAFYDRLMPFLGLRAVFRMEDFVYYVGGRTALGIRRADAEHAALTHVETAPGIEHLCFRARSREDVDAVYAFLLGIGADVVRAPEEGPWAPGYYSLSFRDPEGIRLEVNHVPGAGVLAEGASFRPV